MLICSFAHLLFGSSHAPAWERRCGRSGGRDPSLHSGPSFMTLERLGCAPTLERGSQRDLWGYLSVGFTSTATSILSPALPCWPTKMPGDDPTTMVSRSLAAAIYWNFPSSNLSTMRTVLNYSERTSIPSPSLPPCICALVRSKATRELAIRPNSTLCGRSTGKVGTGSEYSTFSRSSTGWCACRMHLNNSYGKL